MMSDVIPYANTQIILILFDKNAVDVRHHSLISDSLAELVNRFAIHRRMSLCTSTNKVCCYSFISIISSVTCFTWELISCYNKPLNL